jgi:hypothetical protein
VFLGMFCDIIFSMNTPLNSEEITKAVRTAFWKLSDEDREVISALATRLIFNIKQRAKSRKSSSTDADFRFGLDSALEVIAFLGMKINDGSLKVVDGRVVEAKGKKTPLEDFTVKV